MTTHIPQSYIVNIFCISRQVLHCSPVGNTAFLDVHSQKITTPGEKRDLNVSCHAGGGAFCTECNKLLSIKICMCIPVLLAKQYGCYITRQDDKTCHHHKILCIRYRYSYIIYTHFVSVM